jgi:hypothetical protein
MKGFLGWLAIAVVASLALASLEYVSGRILAPGFGLDVPGFQAWWAVSAIVILAGSAVGVLKAWFTP